MKPFKGDGPDGKLISVAPAPASLILPERTLLTDAAGKRQWQAVSGVAVALALMTATGLSFFHGGTVVWEPGFDGRPKRILWATTDNEKPVPKWVQEAGHDPSIGVLLTTTFLTTTGSQTWTNPGATSAQVEMIGSGGSVATGNDSNYWGGGAGGSYGKRNTVSISGNQSYQISLKGSDSLSTWFGSSANNIPSLGTNAADAGQAAVAPSGTFDTSNNGGAGANGSNGSGAFGSGAGGGAGGPNGAGNAGVLLTGGSGDAGAGGAGGTFGNSGAAGTEFDASHGSGGGSGAASEAHNASGMVGGLYGGGAAEGINPGTVIGVGAQGLIVLTYTIAPPAYKRFWGTNIRR